MAPDSESQQECTQGPTLKNTDTVQSGGERSVVKQSEAQMLFVLVVLSKVVFSEEI